MKFTADDLKKFHTQKEITRFMDIISNNCLPLNADFRTIREPYIFDSEEVYRDMRLLIISCRTDKDYKAYNSVLELMIKLRK